MDNFFEKLVDELREKNYSMSEKLAFTSIYDEKERINLLDGDVVECGVFAGGLCVFLTKLFSNKKIWVVDSFTGFEKLDDSRYSKELLDLHNVEEPHVYGYGVRPQLFGGEHPSLEFVKNVFNEYGELDNPNVKFLKGYVKDTLNPIVCPIEKISLLRIDVDAYSATMDVLDYLYPKVVSGGMIIFDDASIESGYWAINDFFKRPNTQELITYDPLIRGTVYGLGNPFCYLIKK